MSHYAVDRQRWAQLTIFEQMGNIYSEVGRTYKARQQGDTQAAEEAVTRALDLFDATVSALVKQKSVRAKEVLRAKDQFLHTVYDQPVDPQDQASLDKYFLNFAVAARLNR
jgi:hypothetical protein